MRVDLRQLLQEHCSAVPNMIKEQSVSDCVLSITQIRDKLYYLGEILDEDLENQAYVAVVRAGIADLSSAVVALQLYENELTIVGYAKEGIIKQNICAKAIQKVVDAVEGKEIRVTSLRKKLLPVILSLIVIISFIAIHEYIIRGVDVDELGDTLRPTETTDAAFVMTVESTIDATKRYNEAVVQFNLAVDEYNIAVVLTCVDNIDDIPLNLDRLSMESEVYADVEAIVSAGTNDIEKIRADTALVLEMTDEVKALTMMVKQITAPEGDWVCNRLVGIEGITECQQVTEKNNPDGLLGKEGGYSACVYFSHSAVVQSEVPGKNIVAKGTDAGGAVEVYPTLEAAQARVDYLSGFDGTILYSGSYAIIGTMVVRTSYKLTDEQQLTLTDSITKALTVFDETAE